MIISYLGEKYFKIQNGNFTILIDPVNQRSFRGADLILKTEKEIDDLNDDFKNEKNIEDYLLIDYQGEFEKKDLIGRGWTVNYEKNKLKTIYLLDFDEMKIAIFNNLKKSLDENIKDYFLGVDLVLGVFENELIPLLKDLSPALIILNENNKIVDDFLKSFNQKEKQILDKLVLKKKDIVFGQTKIICLKS